MVQVLGVDHVVIRVSDYERSMKLYDRLFDFLGFTVIDHFSDMAGWRALARDDGVVRHQHRY